jgi:hypothetical protein
MEEKGQACSGPRLSLSLASASLPKSNDFEDGAKLSRWLQNCIILAGGRREDRGPENISREGIPGSFSVQPCLEPPTSEATIVGGSKENTEIGLTWP